MKKIRRLDVAHFNRWKSLPDWIFRNRRPRRRGQTFAAQQRIRFAKHENRNIFVTINGGDKMSLSRSLHTILIGAAFVFVTAMLFI
ncbi:hypothetical protein JET14_05750 [Martelella lutilitoris]|uniref:Uncharacterized protein n=1 Tax=Martelella lutilitoris TaxID=2583532 RepID=A0A7T7HM51_9HYPH|nr:hypothetical protein [Martelella lutilitoris]QQM31672.1 hypothetical protein JET14_05750 [Martelella lutilitoris]